MIGNQSRSLESMLPVALFVNIGLFVRANIKGAKEFCQSIQQVKMIWGRQRSLSGAESVQSAHLKQIDDLLDFAAREKVAKLIQRGVINREDVVFEGNDRNPAASAARGATDATARNPPPFKTEAMQEADAIAAVERQILKDIQESEYQAALAADKKKEEEQRQAEEAEARALAEQQRAEEEAEVPFLHEERTLPRDHPSCTHLRPACVDISHHCINLCHHEIILMPRRPTRCGARWPKSTPWRPSPPSPLPTTAPCAWWCAWRARGDD